MLDGAQQKHLACLEGDLVYLLCKRSSGFCLENWAADDVIGLDDVSKESFPVEVMGLGDGLPAGGALDDAFAVDIPGQEFAG